MKRILTVFFLFSAVTAFSQNMSSYFSEFTRIEGTFNERLSLLEEIRAAGYTGIGEFYHNALKYFFTRLPDVRTRTEQSTAERTAILLCEELGKEKYTDAAAEIWQIVELFDVGRDATDGNAMQTALFTLGDIDAKDFVPHIVLRLDNFNSQTITNPETRRRMQMGVTGCVRSLEALHDIRGFRPVFFVSVGTYDPSVRNVASSALLNMVDDPGDVIIEIIQDSSNNPQVKLTAWNEMLRSRASNSSKAKVAAAAIAVSWYYSTSNQPLRTLLIDMRKSAIDTVRRYGVADDSVYDYLERSYLSNLNNNAPDYDEIMRTLNALAAVRTDKAVGLLRNFLVELNERRRAGPWGDRERRLFEWVVSCLGATRTQNIEVRILLATMERNPDFTSQERTLVRNALGELSAR